MRFEDLEHVVHAAAVVTDDDELVVIGSQAILGSFPDAPDVLLRSIEADLYPRNNPEKADLIDGALGDGSPFQRSHGYYAHAVGPRTAKAPAGWEQRLVSVPIRPRPASSRRPTALCLEPHDLVLAKCAAGRPRDWEFAAEAVRAGLLEESLLVARIAEMPIEDEAKDHIRGMLSAMFQKGREGTRT